MQVLLFDYRGDNMSSENMDYVKYVKEHIQSDIDTNKQMTGTDYSAELGNYLFRLLVMPSGDAQEHVIEGLEAKVALEELGMRMTGKKPPFLESLKCAIAVYRIRNEYDPETSEKAVDELLDYAISLRPNGLFKEQ